MRTTWTLVGVVALLSCLAPRASAQTVRGQIVDQQTAAPIQGAFIRLVDSAGVARDAVLSDSSGNFTLTAPGAGRYTLRAERIGYASTFSDTLDVAAGKTVLYRFAVPVQAINLEGLDVRGSKRCDVSTKEGAETNVLWNAARKTLDVVAWMETEQRVPFQSIIWVRTRDIATFNLTEGEQHILSGFGQSAFRSQSAEDLAQNGFVRTTASGGLVYYGLDAQTLLSDVFLSGHCFRVAKPPKGEKQLVGLSFEPLNRDGPPDIQGTLWLDRRTSELRYLAFHYTRFPYPMTISESYFGGRIEFRRMDNGAWIVGRWWLRSVVGANRGRLRVHEEGGKVAWMALPPSAGDSGTAALQGTVWDSVRARPLAGAAVFLTDVGKAVLTDRLGRFHMSGLPAGRHDLGFFHPFTDSLQLRAPTRQVDLVAGELNSADLGVPADAGCPSSPNTATVVGFIQSVANGDPIPGVVATGIWRESEKGPDSDPVEHTTRTDELGRYLFCGVPLEERVTLQATAGPPLRVDLRSPGIHSEDLIAGTARF